MDLRDFKPSDELLRDTPRRAVLRRSLDHARVQDAQLSRLAASPDRAGQRRAHGIPETEAAAAPPKEQIPACWDRPNASYSLLHADVDSQAFKYARVQLRTAATLCAAELQVSRKIQAPELQLRIFKLVMSANGLVRGWWKGRQLGLIQFLAEAGKSNGSVYTYAWAFRRG